MIRDDESKPFVLDKSDVNILINKLIKVSPVAPIQNYFALIFIGVMIMSFTSLIETMGFIIGIEGNLLVHFIDSLNITVMSSENIFGIIKLFTNIFGVCFVILNGVKMIKMLEVDKNKTCNISDFHLRSLLYIPAELNLRKLTRSEENLYNSLEKHLIEKTNDNEIMKIKPLDIEEYIAKMQDIERNELIKKRDLLDQKINNELKIEDLIEIEND